MRGAILMYHRITPKAGARPWFARGTAVTPEAFELQMRWLVSGFEVVSLPELLGRVFRGEGEEAEERVLAAVTFDDGYRDVLEYAEPICRELGILGAVFPCLAPRGPAPSPLWFDKFYSLLEARLGADTEATGIEGRSLAEWVRGDFKGRLQAAGSPQREAILDQLAERWEVEGAASTAYLSFAELEAMVARGWTVGGHGVAHNRLTALDNESLLEELRSSLELTRRCGQPVAILAYPDGAYDDRIRGLALDAGFSYGLTVRSGVIDGMCRSMEVPRFFCRGDGAIPHSDLAELASP